jgi:hypothetical protein
MQIQLEAMQRLNDYLGELERRKERLRRFWQGESLGRRPLSFIPYDMTPRQTFDEEEQFRRAAPYILRIMELPGDTVPVFWPDMGTIALASVFGGTLLREAESNLNWIEPIFSSLDEAQSLEMPDALSGQVKVEFDRCRRWRDLTDGRWPVSPPDMQGPVSMASMLVDQSQLIVGMFEKPDVVRRILRICTDVILNVLERYAEEFGETLAHSTWPHVWFPREYGTMLTQDSIPSLSPALYRDFELPLVKELSEKTGGLYIHCCGSFEYALDGLREVPNIIGVDHAYPHSHAEVILEKLGMQTVITSHPSSQGETEFPTLDRYIEFLEGMLPEEARVWYVLPADLPEVTSRSLAVLGLDEMKRAYEKMYPV